MSRWSRWARRMERKSRKIREGEGNLSSERFPSPSLKPSPFPPKTFDFIESLLLVFRVDEKLFHRYGWEEFFIWGYWCCPYWREGGQLYWRMYRFIIFIIIIIIIIFFFFFFFFFFFSEEKESPRIA